MGLFDSRGSAGRIVVVALAWTAICGAIFLFARELDRPVPAAGFGHAEAEKLALDTLVERDAKRYGDYIVINSASSEIGSPNGRRRWVVLCNRASGATAETAILVELEHDGSEVLGFRRPGQTVLEPDLP